MITIKRINENNFSLTRTVNGREETNVYPCSYLAHTLSNNILLYNENDALLIIDHFSEWNIDEATFTNAQDCATAINQIVSGSSVSSFVQTQEITDNALEQHNTSPTAHPDIRAAIKGTGGYLPANDFGTPTPTQQQLTDYALLQMPNISHAADIWNGTRVKNTNNGYLWLLNNTPDTDPAVFEWINNGLDTVNIANNTTLGVVKGSEDNLKISVDENGEMSVTGLQDALDAKLNSGIIGIFQPSGIDDTFEPLDGLPVFVNGSFKAVLQGFTSHFPIQNCHILINGVRTPIKKSTYEAVSTLDLSYGRCYDFNFFDGMCILSNLGITPDAPANGKIYARSYTGEADGDGRAMAWEEIQRIPTDNKKYVKHRRPMFGDEEWIAETIQQDAPANGNSYVRKYNLGDDEGQWVPETIAQDAPIDGHKYIRQYDPNTGYNSWQKETISFDASNVGKYVRTGPQIGEQEGRWEKETISQDAPSDGGNYVRRFNFFTNEGEWRKETIPQDAPSDGRSYLRKYNPYMNEGEWVAETISSDAPSDGTKYIRQYNYNTGFNSWEEETISQDVPGDGAKYSRKRNPFTNQGEWERETIWQDAPMDGRKYIRTKNPYLSNEGIWELETIEQDAPMDSGLYVRQNGNWLPLSINLPPYDGRIYGLQNGYWVPIGE